MFLIKLFHSFAPCSSVEDIIIFSFFLLIGIFPLFCNVAPAFPPVGSEGPLNNKKAITPTPPYPPHQLYRIYLIFWFFPLIKDIAYFLNLQSPVHWGWIALYGLSHFHLWTHLASTSSWGIRHPVSNSYETFLWQSTSMCFVLSKDLLSIPV